MIRHSFSRLSNTRLIRVGEQRIKGKNASIRKRLFSNKEGKEGTENVTPKETVISEIIEEPTTRQLRIVALRSAIPM